MFERADVRLLAACRAARSPYPGVGGLRLLIYFIIDLTIFIPVVPHKAVAEVSKIGNL
jgi:hypothetical protein